MVNLLILTVIFIMFVLVALFWHQVCRMTSEESLCMSAVLVMLSVFFAAMAGHVRCAYYVLGFVAAVGLLAFIFDVSAVKGETSPFYKRLFIFINPSLLMLAILFFYSLIAFHGAVFTYPDELFQWGTAVRYMAENGGLPYGPDFPGASITLSMATMFQYIWVGVRSFVESNCFIGNFLLAFIPVYLPFSGATWRDWKKVGLFTVMVFLALNVLTYVKYYNLLQDFVLPMWAGGIIAWLIWSKKEKLNWWLLLGSLLCIGAMKSMVSPLFAGIIMVTLLIRQILLWQPKTRKDFLNKKTVGLGAAVLLSAVVLNMLWSVLINENAYNRFSTFDSEYKSLSDITKGIIGRAFTVMSGEIGAFPYGSYFMAFAMEGIALLVLRKKLREERERKQFTIIFTLYEVGFVAYMLVMLYAYAVVFDAADSAIVAGLERYFAYYMLLGVVPWFALLFQENIWSNAKGIKMGVLILGVVLILGTGNGFISKISTVGIEENDAYKDRLDMQEQKTAIDMLTGGEGSLCILGTLSYDESKILAYELKNRYTWNTDCYQLYHRNEDDMEVYCDLVRYPQLIERLQYDYMWIYNYDIQEEQVKKLQYRYGLKDLKDGALYAIDRTSEVPRLVYKGNTKKLLGDED